VPVPRAASFTALNEQLIEGCRRRLAERPRGHDETIGERVARDLAAFQDLPPAPYDACVHEVGRNNRLTTPTKWLKLRVETLTPETQLQAPETALTA
jgi:hypothetical protein